MEIVDPTKQSKHRHEWLEWIGLEEPPPKPDTWVPVATGMPVDDPGSNPSSVAGRLIGALKDAKIEAHPRVHEFLNDTRGTGIFGVGVESSYLAVLVQDRDLHRAVEVAHGFQTRLEHEPRGESGFSDEELARLALESPPPPD